MGHLLSKFKFNSMKYFLLYILIKYPEINNNYLAIIIFRFSKLLPYNFNINFTRILLLTSSGALDWNGGLGPNKKNRPWDIYIYTELLIDILVATLDIIWKKEVYREFLRQAHLNWFLYRVTLEIGHNWILFLRGNLILFRIIRNLFGEYALLKFSYVDLVDSLCTILVQISLLNSRSRYMRTFPL